MLRVPAQNQCRVLRQKRMLVPEESPLLTAKSSKTYNPSDRELEPDWEAIMEFFEEAAGEDLKKLRQELTRCFDSRLWRGIQGGWTGSLPHRWR